MLWGKIWLMQSLLKFLNSTLCNTLLCKRFSFQFGGSMTMKNLYIEFKFVAGFQKGWTQFITWESKIVSEIVYLMAVVDGCLFNFTEVLELWRNANAVCFDVDSTVCVDEGIDELAEFCGAGKAVAEWTARWDILERLAFVYCPRVFIPNFIVGFSRAMGGSVPFEEALAARLSLFKPSLSQVQDFLEQKPPRWRSYFYCLSIYWFDVCV